MSGQWSDVLRSLETDQGSIALTHMYAALGVILPPVAEKEQLGLHRAMRALNSYLRERAPSPPTTSNAATSTTIACPPASYQFETCSPDDGVISDDSSSHPSTSGSTLNSISGGADRPMDSEEQRLMESRDALDLAQIEADSGGGSPSCEQEQSNNEVGNGYHTKDAIIGATPRVCMLATRTEAVLARGELARHLRQAAGKLLPDVAIHVDSICCCSGCMRGGSLGCCENAKTACPGDIMVLSRAKATSVTFFLNRLLGLALSDQALMLHLFNYMLNRAVRRAQNDGALDCGIEKCSTPMMVSDAFLAPHSTGPTVRCVHQAQPSIFRRCYAHAHACACMSSWHVHVRTCTHHVHEHAHAHAHARPST